MCRYGCVGSRRRWRRMWRGSNRLWCEGLRRFGGPFLAGAAFGAVDAFFAPVAFRVQSYGLGLSAPAAVRASAEFAGDAGMVCGGSAGDAARAEGHEAEVLLAAGTITEDLRARA